MANISSLVQQSGYRLIRISDLEETDVVKGFSLPWRPTWSEVELNHGSWEIGILLSHVSDFQNLVRKVSNANIDLEYNPLFVPEHDVEYFISFATAHYMHGFWLEARLGSIYGIPRYFYNVLACIQRLIC